jgi:hypothetical protein
MEDQAKNMKTVYTVVDRGPGRSFWVRIGVGYTNRDGSLNLRLDAVPVNGTLQVRDWEPNDRRGETLDGPALHAAGRTPRPRDPASDSLA